ncbi:hypothetical protein M432DRAFT_636177 [Thermoascus aurantiacus ATCC 26904]
MPPAGVRDGVLGCEAAATAMLDCKPGQSPVRGRRPRQPDISSSRVVVGGEVTTGLHVTEQGETRPALRQAARPDQVPISVSSSSILSKKPCSPRLFVLRLLPLSSSIPPTPRAPTCHGDAWEPVLTWAAAIGVLLPGGWMRHSCQAARSSGARPLVCAAQSPPCKRPDLQPGDDDPGSASPALDAPVARNPCVPAITILCPPTVSPSDSVATQSPIVRSSSSSSSSPRSMWFGSVRLASRSSA